MGRRADNHRPIGNITNDDGTGAYRGVFPDAEPRQYDGAQAEKGSILNVRTAAKCHVGREMDRIANLGMVADHTPHV